MNLRYFRMDMRYFHKDMRYFHMKMRSFHMDVRYFDKGLRYFHIDVGYFYMDAFPGNTAMFTTNTGRKEHTNVLFVELTSLPQKPNMILAQAGLHSMMLLTRRISGTEKMQVEVRTPL